MAWLVGPTINLEGQSKPGSQLNRNFETLRPRAESPGGDIPATGKSVTLELCDVFKIEDGKIKSLRSYFDSASLLMQLGVMPEAGVATAN